MKRQTENAERARYNNAQEKGRARCVAIANKPTKRGRWRETRRKGVPCLVSPDGRVYYGTAQEVRDAALTPTRRDMLAQSLRFARDTADVFRMSPDDRRAYYAAKRRDAMHFGSLDARANYATLNTTERDYILLTAGARLAGYDSFADYVHGLIHCEIEALLDVAESKTGNREIPLTRHERAALERIEAQEARGLRSAGYSLASVRGLLSSRRGAIPAIQDAGRTAAGTIQDGGAAA